MELPDSIRPSVRRGVNVEDEVCEVCKEKVTYCGCLRCVICGVIYDEDAGPAALSEEGYCAECHMEEYGV